MGKLSNKFNRLLQFQAVEGRALFDDGQLDLAEGECVSSSVLICVQKSFYDSVYR